MSRFLSTPSGWRATGCMRFKDLQAKISIHALRVEGDRASYIHTRRTNYFYPRPPGGGRPRPRRYTRCNHLFLSTPSGWRATTIAQGQFIGTQGISIHALRVEGDTSSKKRTATKCNFYPRPPGGGRHERLTAILDRRYFYPRPPGGGRLCLLPIVHSLQHFYPRPPGGGRRFRVCRTFVCVKISIHALRVEGDQRFDSRKA